MRCCSQITDAAFVHLKGIHTLNMDCCDQITDVALVHLKGIHTLDMDYLGNQITIEGLDEAGLLKRRKYVPE
jgi:hypothetical protein